MSEFSRSMAAQAAAMTVVAVAKEKELLTGPLAVAPALADSERVLLQKMMTNLNDRRQRPDFALTPDEVSALFTFVFAKAGEAVTTMMNGGKDEFDLMGMLDGKPTISAADPITARFKELSFPGDCAEAYLLWAASAEGQKLLRPFDPLLPLFEALKWCFRISCHLAIEIVEKC